MDQTELVAMLRSKARKSGTQTSHFRFIFIIIGLEIFSFRAYRCSNLVGLVGTQNKSRTHASVEAVTASWNLFENTHICKWLIASLFHEVRLTFPQHLQEQV